MMKMKFSFLSKNVKPGAVMTGFALLLCFLLSGVSLSAQSLATQGGIFPSFSVKTYNNDFPSKNVLLNNMRDNLSAVHASQPATPAAEASKAVRVSFLVDAMENVRVLEMEPLEALTAAYSKAVARSQDFSIDVNTVQIFNEYYNLFSL